MSFWRPPSEPRVFITHLSAIQSDVRFTEFRMLGKRTHLPPMGKLLYLVSSFWEVSSPEKVRIFFWKQYCLYRPKSGRPPNSVCSDVSWIWSSVPESRRRERIWQILL